MNAKSTTLKELLAVNNGVVKMRTLNENGFTRHDVGKFIQDGLLERIKQGYYMEIQRDVSDTEIAAKLIPMGVLCLFSAVEYHGLATINPTEICIALPRGVTCPVLPPKLLVKIYHMTDSHFKAGVFNAEVNGVTIKIYDAEKTVCDCFKYDKEIERNIALEVLKNYITRGGCDIQRLLEYAKLIGKKKIIYPYVEALI